MAKTSPSDVWNKPIKTIGNGYIDLICKCADQGGAVLAGTGMEVGDDGALTKFTTDQPDHPSGVIVAEDIADDDTYFLGRKKGATILHNQKLASTYSIGDAVYKSDAGTWTYADKDTAESLLHEVGIVCGPADRITSGVIKDLDDAFTATEGVDICV